MANDIIERLKEKSLNGLSGIINQEKASIDYDDYIKRVKIIVGSTALAVTLALGGGNLLVNKIKDRAALTTLKYDYYESVLKPEVHITDDKKNYWYDYGNIARNLENQEDFDEALYFLKAYIDDQPLDSLDQINSVLNYTEYKNFDNYKEIKGYESDQDYENDMKERALTKYERNQKQAELDKMQQEVESNKNIAEINKGYGDK